MIALWLLACGGSPPEPRPAGVPEAAAFLRYSGNDLMLDQARIAPWTELGTGGTDQPFGPLLDALEARLAKEAGTWIALPANASWTEARRAAHTVFQADAGPIWLGALGTDQAFGPLDNRPPSRPILSCPDGPLPVTGAGVRLTIELHADPTGTWALAHARFAPQVLRAGAPVTAELLPASCWAPPPCADLGPLADACTQGAHSPLPLPDRVEVAGPSGCALPTAADATAWSAWRAQLGATLTGLGLGPDTQVMVMASEYVELSALLAVLGGLRDHGVHNPQLGMLRMGSADTPPECQVAIRDADALQQAGARWLGQQLGALTGPGDP